MPIVPNLPERLLFLRLNRAPAPLLDVFGAVAFRAALAALKLGVFEELREGPLAPADLAGRLGTDERGTLFLLRALEPLGYVTGSGERYANSEMTARWLLAGSPTSVAAGFCYWGAVLPELWGDLEETVKSGRPRTNLYAWFEENPGASRDFQEWMVAASRLMGGEISRKLGLPKGARRLLDVGGGHGSYSIALCERYPRLVATVFDLPEALASARQNVAAAGMEYRVELREGNFLEDELPAGYDVALLFNIVHGFEPEQNAALLGKVAATLRPGGTVAVAEQLAGETFGSASKAFGGLLGLSYLQLLGGRTYAYEEVLGWMREAGFGEERRVDIVRAPGSSLILATKRVGERK